MDASSAFFVSGVKFREVIVLQTLARYLGPLVSRASGWIPDLRKPDLEVCTFLPILLIYQFAHTFLVVTLVYYVLKCYLLLFASYCKYHSHFVYIN